MDLELFKKSATKHAKAMGEGLLRSVWDFVKWASITAIVIIFVTRVFVVVAVVPSESMEPTLPTWSFLIGLRTDYWNNDPQRGNIVIFHRSADGNKLSYTKRIVGLPGETVEIREGITYINGAVYEEPWLAEKPEKLDFGPYIVPEEAYFCMGDNRNRSNDCRYWEERYVLRQHIYARGRLVFGAGKLGIFIDEKGV